MRVRRYFTKFYLESNETKQRLFSWFEFIGYHVLLGRAKCVIIKFQLVKNADLVTFCVPNPMLEDTVCIGAGECYNGK